MVNHMYAWSMKRQCSTTLDFYMVHHVISLYPWLKMKKDLHYDGGNGIQGFLKHKHILPKENLMDHIQEIRKKIDHEIHKTSVIKTSTTQQESFPNS